MDITTTQGMKQALTDKLRLGFGVTPEEADDAQVMRAAALVLRDVMTERGVESRMATRREEKRKVHYLSMEFLLGRSLEKNAYNLGVSGVLREAIGELGFRAADIFEVEPDAGLGNGGLGRLAACYLDSMTTLDIPAAGYSICYELGIFRQRIVDGQQVELPDNWKDIGGAWLMPKPQETEEVLFGGTQVLGQRTAARRARGRDEGARRALRHGDHGLRHRARQPPAPVGREVPDAGGYEPVLAGRIPARERAGGDGGDHRQDPLSRGQPL